MKAVKTIVQILLFFTIVALGYFIYIGVMKPIDFANGKEARYKVVVQRLKDIRTAQIAHKSVYGKYTSSFDTLIHFVKEDSFPVEFAEGSLDDSLAVAMGLVVRDTFYVHILDSIFPPGYPTDSLRYVPFTDDVQFELKSGFIMTASKVEVQVFEATAQNFDILNGMDRQLIINLNDLTDFPGLKVGSIDEANNNAGNWE
ncbi:MAG: hypothetical protein HN352_13035 [Bacteroidetes bacterium]|jgi:hypothetical protein|nr:hypothetical protein [Bacteroidota bacterium]MBT3747699.1 hypothetical protein [Bacteroidota bacterium]MBT4398449.1 hypothetical protein [Bacteroidota bacterium]MBT4411954.1 hypothetical protein [Bacteroidota bacterium]MBT5427770.1 hypothetical protein [Bacteroidota bacterium]